MKHTWVYSLFLLPSAAFSPPTPVPSLSDPYPNPPTFADEPEGSADAKLKAAQAMAAGTASPDRVSAEAYSAGMERPKTFYPTKRNDGSAAVEDAFGE